MQQDARINTVWFMEQRKERFGCQLSCHTETASNEQSVNKASFLFSFTIALKELCKNSGTISGALYVCVCTNDLCDCAMRQNCVCSSSSLGMNLYICFTFYGSFPLYRIWVLTSSRPVPLQTILIAKQCPLVLVRSQLGLTWRGTWLNLLTVSNGAPSAWPSFCIL